MIESSPLAFSHSDAAPRRRESASADAGAGFSYALAAASLEKNAAKSLEAHGARPMDAAAASSQTPSQRVNDDASKPATPQSTAAVQQSASETANAPANAAAPRNAAPTPPVVSASAGAPAQNAAAPAALAPAPIKSADIAAARNMDAAKARSAAAKAPRLPSAPAALKTEFAEILARRLEKTSVFDLRLDPPELGRVEGRLAINDDGKSVLSLTFDNQSAFDLFSRDEQALRQALQQAGLQFDAGDFAFAFRERTPADAAPIGRHDLNSAAPEGAYDPQFFAEWSAGALDIRI